MEAGWRTPAGSSSPSAIVSLGLTGKHGSQDLSLHGYSSDERMDHAGQTGVLGQLKLDVRRGDIWNISVAGGGREILTSVECSWLCILLETLLVQALSSF